MAEIYNRTLVETKAAMLLIPQSARVLANNSSEIPACSIVLAAFLLGWAVLLHGPIAPDLLS